MTESKIRWGILGTAQIARKNWQAIRNAGNSTLTAVASRDVKRSRQFIAECQGPVPFDSPPEALGSYEQLLQSETVDALYIPLPTGLRKEWVIRAAQAGKHIVCEKPCAIHPADLREMLAACRQHQVQFMDGVMFMHSRRMDKLRETLDDGTSIGQLKRIASGFSFRAPEDFLTGNIRMNSDLEPLGCLGDLGWYCIRFALWTMNWQLPLQVTGRFLSQLGRKDSPNPVPTEFSMELLFEGGVSAGFYCSFLTENQEWINLSGTKGHLEIQDFVLPFYGSELAFDLHNHFYSISGCQFNMENHSRRIAVPEYSNSHPSAQETNLFRNFADRLLAGKIETSWAEIALKTQLVANACFDSARNQSQPVKPETP